MAGTLIVWALLFPPSAPPQPIYIKRTARLAPAVQVREGTPGEGSDKGIAADLIPRIRKPCALTGLNFCLGFAFPAAECVADQDCDVRRAFMVLGLWLDQVPCSSRNAPATLIASTTKRSFVSAADSSATAPILRSNMIDAAPPTSVQVMLRARIGVTSRPSYLRPNIPQFC